MQVALVELGGSHAETLHAQIHWLDGAGHGVHLICNPGLQEHIIEKDRLAGQLSITTRPKQKSPIVAFSQFQRIRHYCKEHGIRRLILNTSEVNEVRYLIFLARFAGLRCDGILHNGSKLSSSWLLRRLARFNMQHVLVMHDFVRSRAQPVSGVAMGAFYPIYFPSGAIQGFNADLSKGCDTESQRRFRVVIVGTMLRTRKDSMALAEELQVVDLASNVEIEVLGHFDHDVDPDMFERFSQARCFGEQFKHSPGFKEYSAVHRSLSNADLMLPLLYPRGQDSFYGEHRVSGAMNAAFAYKIPMLMHESWRGVPDYDASSFYHANSQLVRCMNALAQDQAAVENKKQRMLEYANFDEAVQGQRYLSFLGLESPAGCP